MSMCCVWICGRRYGQVHLCFLPSLFVSLDSCVSLDSRKEQFACATRPRMNVPILVSMKYVVQDNRMARIMTIDARQTRAYTQDNVFLLQMSGLIKHE